MKERTKGLIAGLLVGTTLFGITGTALAASGAITLDVIPVKIKVNNEVFQPKDVNGNNVMVFAYNGTTYAPLRALAEAYGLEVGWDQASGTATVVDPEKVVKESVSATSSGGASAEALERWMAKKVAAPQWTGINVIKIGDKYYEYYDFVERKLQDYKITYDNGESLVFTRDIIVAQAGHFATWELMNLMRQSLMTDYIIHETENPYFDGRLMIQKPTYGLEGIVTAGIDPTQYLSATTTYTPMWIESNGVKVYNVPRQNGFYVKDGIRYYDGMVCCNDILAKLGIDKSFSIGEYQGLLCIEWEE